MIGIVGAEMLLAQEVEPTSRSKRDSAFADVSTFPTALAAFVVRRLNGGGLCFLLIT
jgi:hypothetical protein